MPQEATTKIVSYEDVAKPRLDSVPTFRDFQDRLFPLMREKLPEGEELTAQQVCERVLEAFREYTRDFAPVIARNSRVLLDERFSLFTSAFLDVTFTFMQEVELHYLRSRDAFLRGK